MLPRGLESGLQFSSWMPCAVEERYKPWNTICSRDQERQMMGINSSCKHSKSLIIEDRLPTLVLCAGPRTGVGNGYHELSVKRNSRRIDAWNMRSSTGCSPTLMRASEIKLPIPLDPGSPQVMRLLLVGHSIPYIVRTCITPDVV